MDAKPKPYTNKHKQTYMQTYMQNIRKACMHGCKTLSHGTAVSLPYLSNAIILGEVDSKGYELRGGGQIIHMHQQV